MKRIVLYIFLFLAAISCCRSNVTVDSSVVDSFLAGDTVFPSILGNGTVRHTNDVIRTALEKYRHSNVKALDYLFPDWENVPVNVRLTVDSPVETMVTHNPPEIVIDVYLLSCYALDDETLKQGICDLVAHESVNVIMETLGLGQDETLDGLAYREGFAGLLSFAGQKIEDVDWKTQRDKHFKHACDQLQKAMDCGDPDILNIASSGSYYDKYVAVSAMLYLSMVYEKTGLPGLKDELEKGPEGFCARILK